MAVTPITFCGTTYNVPQQGDASAWGTSLTAYLLALGAPAYYQSATASPAQSGIIRLAKTDTLVWRNNAGSGDVALSKGTSDQLQWNGVDFTGNPQAIYTTAAGQSFTSGSTAILNYGTSELDTHNAVAVGASWRFTVPTGKGGLYAVSAAAMWNAAITTGAITLQLFKNGSLWRTLFKVVTGTNTPQTMMTGSTNINLAAADYVDVRVTQSSGSPVVLSSTAAENAISIHRIIT